MNSKHCVNCNIEFFQLQRPNKDWKKQKYCSKACSTKHSNTTNPRRIKEGECRTCKKQIAKDRRYCCKECIPIRAISIKEYKANAVKSVIAWRVRTKQKLVDYKGGKCIICNYNKTISALQFHHLDPSQKDFTISGKSWAYESLLNEVDKCVLLCNRCHTEVHDGVTALPLS